MWGRGKESWKCCSRWEKWEGEGCSFSGLVLCLELSGTKVQNIPSGSNLSWGTISATSGTGGKATPVGLPGVGTALSPSAPHQPHFSCKNSRCRNTLEFSLGKENISWAAREQQRLERGGQEHPKGNEVQKVARNERFLFPSSKQTRAVPGCILCSGRSFFQAVCAPGKSGEVWPFPMWIFHGLRL